MTVSSLLLFKAWRFNLLPVLTKSTCSRKTVRWSTSATLAVSHHTNEKRAKDHDIFIVQAAANANTFAIHGRSTEKELAELIPSILNQLGPDSMAALKKLAESFKQAQGEDAAAAGEDDDEIPDLVESFDKAEIQEEKKEESSA